MAKSITSAVRDRYAAVARSSLSGRHKGVKAVAEAFGYSSKQLSSIPAEANMGLSCGNPTAMAGLRSGEVVVDLGCGGGLDVFLAARKVGPRGKAIGIDMTPSMIERARKNAQGGKGRKAFTNVEFHLATIDKLPLAKASVDCVISNCVINLAPDKLAVFKEIARVLKPGGRVAVSDIALKKPLPKALKASVAAYVGCIAGAISIAKYQQLLKKAGFSAVEVVDSRSDLNAYAKVESQSGCCSPSMDGPAPGGSCRGGGKSTKTGCCGGETDVHGGLAHVLGRYDVNDYAASVKVYAIKPG